MLAAAYLGDSAGSRMAERWVARWLIAVSHKCPHRIIVLPEAPTTIFHHVHPAQLRRRIRVMDATGCLRHSLQDVVPERGTETLTT